MDVAAVAAGRTGFGRPHSLSGHVRSLGTSAVVGAVARDQRGRCRSTRHVARVGRGGGNGGGTAACHDGPMAQVFAAIDEKLTRWLLRQPMLVVATAPLAGDGHINVSPKGMGGTFAVLDPHRVAYLDYTGSGVETISHVRENGRIVLMFSSFEGAPKIVRLHGRGRIVLPEDAEFAELRAAFPKARTIGQRSIVVVDLERISDSCGYAVPLMDFRADRDVLDRSQERRDQDYIEKYWHDHNAASIDGLPGMPRTALL